VLAEAASDQYTLLSPSKARISPQWDRSCVDAIEEGDPSWRERRNRGRAACLYHLRSDVSRVLCAFILLCPTGRFDEVAWGKHSRTPHGRNRDLAAL